MRLIGCFFLFSLAALAQFVPLNVQQPIQMQNQGITIWDGGGVHGFGFADVTGMIPGGLISGVTNSTTAQVVASIPGKSGSVGVSDYFFIMRFAGPQNKWYFGADDTRSYIQTGLGHDMWFNPTAGGIIGGIGPTLAVTANAPGGRVGVLQPVPQTELDVNGDITDERQRAVTGARTVCIDTDGKLFSVAGSCPTGT